MKVVVNMKRVAVVVALASVLAGCSTVKGWFTDDKKAAEKAATEPVKLEKFEPSIKVDKLWSASVGKGEKLLGVRQGPAVADGHVYAAAIEGGVKALDLQTGKELWHHKMKDERVSAVGAGDGLVVIGTLSGKLFALDPATGEEKWTAKASNEIIAPPTIGQGNVLVHANDGQVLCFQVTDGVRRWFWNREQPPLTVRGNGPVTLGPGLVFVGNDDGTMTALALNDGHALWDQTVGQPEGRTELDRMADVDGPPVIDGTTLFASSYKNATLAIDGPSGRPMWSRDKGGVAGLGLAPSSVVLSDKGGVVWALDKTSGGSLWSNQKLLRRALTAPAVQGDYAVVGDYDGYVHWLRLDNGELAARERAGGDPIRATPVVADGVLLVQNVDGKLTAFRIK
ncbi:outer membrane protein assembly factor BamB [Pseudoxanthomonas sp. X-1]|uniref:outer membrane protein assembly factor BamB n=1 Tax=Pseudoxanthomonas sp. X-1 TaxID=2571115 RepID=UPI000DB0CBAF|nr:outer membrane protein assembly factor BamB [Pseudoxanthomonas sp. X-1]PZP61844.1 MAG: outer membrane protein assembly factor BamB [Pseudoxanthomonas spadix]TMN25718.1 outer membrane protein assembly factor BamB [Pseudoxanthomonas sp. X-1]UAY73024.1 outer membrane protein assembly factor BamB [Pseudoxanthomonas sp. X-1]